MTPDLLIAAVGCTPERAAKFAEPLSAACAAYGIDTNRRLAAFLAQIGHESGSFKFTSEVWGPTPAQAGYEGRADLGNVKLGDGSRYRGHGLVQITGRFNHARVRDRLRKRFPDAPDFEADPEALTQPKWACLSAADYWDDKNLNALADTDQFAAITKKINGGLNGQADRIARWERAKKALPLAPVETRVPNLATNAASLASKEEPMAPFIAAALPALIEAAPALIRIFGESPRAEKNAKAAEVVADIAKRATGETTVEGAVTAIATDQQAAAAYREAVHVSMGDLLTALEKINDMDLKNVEAARAYNTAEPVFIEFGWLRLKFIHLLSLMFVIFSGAFVWRYWPDLTPELKGAVITLMVIAGWNGVKDYWMSSSAGSDKKTEIMNAAKGQ
jgi:putative chitinase